MEILQVTSGYPPMIGGAENSVYQVVKRLQWLGNRVIVITAKNDSTFTVPSNDVCRLPVRLKFGGRWGEVFFCPSVFSAMKEVDFEIVHAHTPRKLFAESVAIFKLLSRKKFPYIVSIRLINTSLAPFLRAFSDVYRRTVECLVFKFAKKVVVQTKANKRLLIKNCGISENKIEIIPNGVDTEMFRSQPSRDEFIEQKYGIENEKVVLFAGRLTSQKGLEYLLRAVPAVIKEYSNVKFIIVGKGPSESYLKEMSKSLNVHTDVTFLGSIPHTRMPELYSLANVFVLPSLSESFPNVLLEAMAMERAIVATRVGVIPEIIFNEETAVLVDPGKVKELANKIVELLLDNNLSRKLGQRARKLVLRNYSWDSITRQTLSVYKDALAC